MSEGEVKTIIGTCAEVAQKPGNDWVEFHIDVGSQYPVRLATKLPKLIEQAKAVGADVATWSFKEIEKGNVNPNTGKPYPPDRYLEGVEAGATMIEPTSAPASVNEGAHSTIPAGDKDRAISRMACLKAAAAMTNGSSISTVEDVISAAARFETWIYRDIDSVPFDSGMGPELSEHDQGIPF